ncbi:MAG TPA: glycosyltransferase family 39 protein, partial [Candidatus Hydrogenedentes bacterium]|nr:glycosyltransferase family 39 protein [Candidatus Hydrogenedentota bacterium]
MTLGICLALYGLALIPRLIGWSHESLWWDEYTSVVHLRAPTLVAFLGLNRTLDPATMPLYYALEYLWWHSIADSVNGLRLLSALLNAAAAPLLFLILRRWAGRMGAIMAAVAFAFSPVHVQHGMGIRMYALLVPLAALSVWAWLESLLSASPRRKRFMLALWAVATLLLSWTHPFALLLPMAQGTHLFFSRSWSARMLYGRGLLTVALAAPALAYLASVRFWPRETTETWMRAPSFLTAVADLLWDDVPRWTWQMDWGKWGLNLNGLTGLPVTGAVAILYAASAAVLVGTFLLYGLRREKAAEGRFLVGLLFFWLMLPPVTLYLLSLLWRPCMMPRYTAHASLALYLFMGLGISGRTGKTGKVAAWGLLVSVMLCYLLTLPGPWRTDWRGAARFLAREARTESDTLLVINHTWRDVFLLNVRLDPNIREWALPVAAAETPDAARAVIAWWNRHRNPQGNNAHPAALWVLAAGPYFSSQPPEAVQQMLESQCGPIDPPLAFATVELLWLWHIRSSSVATPDSAEAPETSALPCDHAAVLDHETMHALGDYALAQGTAGRSEEARALLRALGACSAFAGELYYGVARALDAGDKTALENAGLAVQKMWDSYGYLKNGLENYALDGFRAAAEMDPANGLACLEAGLLAAAVQPDEAQSLLAKAADRWPAYGPIIRRLRETLETLDPAGIS